MLPTSVHAADEDDLGRLSIRETIERARSSGVHQQNFMFRPLTLQGTLPRFAQHRVTRPLVSPLCLIPDSSLSDTREAL